jgi:hypothetical protein
MTKRGLRILTFNWREPFIANRRGFVRQTGAATGKRLPLRALRFALGKLREAISLSTWEFAFNSAYIERFNAIMTGGIHSYRNFKRIH